MKAMIGSEKQIQWAEKISAEFALKLHSLVAMAEQRVADGTMPTAWLSAVSAVVADVTASVEKVTGGQAAIWIEHRDRILGFAAEKLIYAAAQKRI